MGKKKPKKKGMRTWRFDFPPPPGPHPSDRLNEEDKKALQELVLREDVRQIVEIGTFLGASAELILDTDPNCTLITIDHYQGGVGTKEKDITEWVPSEVMEQYATGRLRRFKDRVMMLKTDSVSAANYVKDKSIDLVFLDGSHNYEGVIADIEAWMPKLRDGGIMAGHDLYREYDNDKLAVGDLVEYGVHRAVQERFSQHALIGKSDGTMTENSSVWAATTDWYVKWAYAK